jgi:hypothetical protein
MVWQQWLAMGFQGQAWRYGKGQGKASLVQFILGCISLPFLPSTSEQARSHSKYTLLLQSKPGSIYREPSHTAVCKVQRRKRALFRLDVSSRCGSSLFLELGSQRQLFFDCVVLGASTAQQKGLEGLLCPRD